ncbi:hypothetical protein B0H11DRAFT_1929713 [Mycena galericulata]|nr:hypothetical protein B0H11DRAFT_1929713 [Mycena galericulata]
MPTTPGRAVRPLALAASNSHRRYNGGLGIHDPMFSPQYYDATRPWVGLMRWRLDAPDYEDVCSHWESEPDAELFGSLSAKFCERLLEANKDLDAQMEKLSGVQYSRRTLWTNRPREPWQSVVGTAPTLSLYEAAVDRVVAMQRGMREKRAWIELAQWWASNIPEVERMKKDPILEARDDYLGVWINGITEEDGLLFLTHIGVPCFIAHVLPPNAPQGEVVLEDTLVGTRLCEIFDGVSRSEYDRVALASNGGQFSPSAPPDVAVFPAIIRSPLERQRSGSRWQMGLQPMDRLPRFRSLTTTTTDCPRAEEEFIREVEIVPGFPAWMQPPPIADVAPGDRWTTFFEKQRGERSELALICEDVVPVREPKSNETCWYDRRRRRRLYLVSKPEDVEGYESNIRFSRPAPRCSYARTWSNGFVALAPTLWMYATERPAPGDAGSEDVPPTIRDVINHSMEEAISLGPEDEAEKEVDEMDVDTEVPTVASTDAASPVAALAITEPVRPRALPKATFASISGLVLSPYLLFPQMPGTFEPSRMIDWLDAVGKALGNCEWSLVHRFDWPPRAEYLVQMKSQGDAVRLRGIMTSDGEIRESRFLQEDEYRTLLARPNTLKVGERTEAAPISPPPRSTPTRPSSLIRRASREGERSRLRGRLIAGGNARENVRHGPGPGPHLDTTFPSIAYLAPTAAIALAPLADVLTVGDAAAIRRWHDDEVTVGRILPQEADGRMQGVETAIAALVNPPSVVSVPVVAAVTPSANVVAGPSTLPADAPPPNLLLQRANVALHERISEAPPSKPKAKRRRPEKHVRDKLKALKR